MRVLLICLLCLVGVGIHSVSAHSHESHSLASEQSKITEHHHNHSHEKPILTDDSSFPFFLQNPTIRLWTFSLGATFFISVVPFFVLCCIPVNEETDNSVVLNLLLALGAGGLLGDAILHLLPHAQMTRGGFEHDHSHLHGKHSHDSFVGLWFLGGLFFFFVTEKVLRILKRNSSEDEYHGHAHTHASRRQTANKPETYDDEEDSEASSQESTDERQEKKVVSLLNMVSDFLHNATDGLAIGAAFTANINSGLWTTAVVFLHEIPHELGDFAFLVHSGFSKTKAILIQLLTAIGAFIGCSIALLTVNPDAMQQHAQSSWVMPFTAGGFVYIGTVSILSELQKQNTVWMSIGQILALFAGVSIMHVITMYE